MEFARVEMTVDGRTKSQPAPLVLRKGTRLVVLDVKLEGSRVHLLTHTADPLEFKHGEEPVYGCTEFVFNVERRVLMAGDADAIAEVIERWLEWTPAERICSPGISQLCIEP